MAQPGRSPEVDAELKKLQGVQNGEHERDGRVWSVASCSCIEKETV